MNLFVIPSWYPSSSYPIAGIFTKEQVEALAELYPEVNVVVSTWGHHEGEITLRDPLKIFKILRWRWNNRRQFIVKNNGYWEIFHPAISLVTRLGVCSIGQLIFANRNSLVKAMTQFGRFDIIHAHVAYPAGYIAKKLSEEFKIPYILTEHMAPFPFPWLMKKGRPINEIYEAITNAGDVIAVSRSLAERMASFGFKEPTIIPNIVDERRFSTGKPNSHKFTFFTLCVISPQKGIDHLLEAIAYWDPPSDQVEFIIGGGGRMKKNYQMLAESMGLSDRVKWLGDINREAVPELFRACHVYVMPSRYETFGVVYAEAIASGKPVIATRCGGPEDIVNDVNGILVEIGDVKGLAKAMKKIYQHWGEFDSKAIRNDFLDRFSRQAITERLVHIYEKNIAASSVSLD